MLQSETVRKYDTYKDSGIEWIGGIPQVWKYAKLAWCSNFVNGYAFNSENMDIDGEVPVVRIGDIQNGKVIYDTCLKVNNNNNLDQYELKKDDIVMAMSGATTGKLAVVDSDDKAYINQRVGIIRSKNNKFIRYCLDNDCFLQYVGLLSAGSAQPNISMGNILDYKIPYISYDKQQQIADYLDKKCGEIDKVVETEKLVIEKLKEYKQSIITEAVTKGLDKSVPLKDSNIEWIGKIPQHWEVKRTKYTANSFEKGNGITKEDVVIDGDIQCIRYGEIYSKYDRQCTECVSATNLDKINTPKHISKGDILLAGTGELIEEIGKNIVYLGEKPCLAGGDIIILNHNQNPIFLNYALNSIYAQSQKSFGKVKLKVVHISASDIGDIRIAIPSIEEQQQIAEYLDKKCSEIDKAIANKEQVIEKFTEYKKSLIYECVTGKRKVVK